MPMCVIPERTNPMTKTDAELTEGLAILEAVKKDAK